MLFSGELDGIVKFLYSGDLNSKHLNNRPFSYQTTFKHLNARLVLYSDPECIDVRDVEAEINFQTTLEWKYSGDLIIGQVWYSNGQK